MQTEKNLHNYLKKQCALRGVSFDKVESRTRKGFPDVFLARGGRIVLVELKSPSGGGVVSDNQRNVIDDLSAHGVTCFVVSSAAVIDHLLNTIYA